MASVRTWEARMYAAAVNIVWYYSRTNGESITYHRNAQRIAYMFNQQSMTGPYGHQIKKFYAKTFENDIETALADLRGSACQRKLLIFVSKAWFAPVSAELAEKFGSEMSVRSIFKPEEIEDLLN